MLKVALVLGLLLIVGAIVFAKFKPSQTTPKPKETDFYKLSANNIKGEDTKMSIYKNKVVLVVNVASKCGLTPQYEGLEEIYQKYKDQGLVILGFPCNQFNGQEPGTEEEISEFCKLNYGVTFPLFSKIDVKGEQAHPIYRLLVHSTDNNNDIEWNFGKFILSKDGKTIKRFSPQTQPNSKQVIETIEKAIAE